MTNKKTAKKKTVKINEILKDDSTIYLSSNASYQQLRKEQVMFPKTSRNSKLPENIKIGISFD